MTRRQKQVLDYLQAVGRTSNRRASQAMGMNGGAFTKRVSELLEQGYPIFKEWQRDAYTGDRYLDYVYDVDRKPPQPVHGGVQMSIFDTLRAAA